MKKEYNLGEVIGMRMDITEETVAYTEVLNILKHTEKEYFEKVPKKFIDFLEDNSLKYYKFYEPDGDVKTSKLTEQILCYLNLEYWCDEEEKEKLIKIYEENDKKNYEYLNVLEKRKPKENTRVKKNMQIVEKKESFIQKIISKVKSFFSKNR